MPRSRIALLLSTTVPIAAHAPSSMYHGKNSSESWLSRRAVILSPTGAELVVDGSLPSHFDWRNVNGKSFVAADVNQHIPQYCGACWIHGTVAQLNDRIKVFRGAAFPDVMLSRQALVNCVPGEDGTAPGCFGGNSYMIYDYMLKNKVPDETCNPWKAKNEKCTPANVCANCAPPPGYLDAVRAGRDVSQMDMQGGCFAVTNFLGYGVKEYGTINNDITAMMKEIYARGPITCTMDADSDFMYAYSANAEQHEGVYVTDKQSTSTDHDVAITGWGETPGGIKYWIARNSWGTYWGQGGWFKIQRGSNTLNIESECTWAVPEFDQVSLMVEGRIFGDYHMGVHEIAANLSVGFLDQAFVSFFQVPPYLIMFITTLLNVILSALLLFRFRSRSAPRQQDLLG